MAQRDANLLFGIMAVQLKLITPGQAMAAAAAWSVAQERGLGAILVEQGAISLRDRELIDELISRQVAATGGDAAQVYALHGGDSAVQQSFGGSLVFEPTPVQQDDKLYASLAMPAPEADAADAAGPAVSAGAALLTPDADLLPAEHPGRYALRGEQGRGGIGRVLLAFDESIRREIALKELLPTPHAAGGSGGADGGPSRRSRARITRFLREARITGQLEHPGIVPVYELGQRKDGTVYYTMKLLRGVTLADKLRACRSLADRLVLLPHFLDLCHAIAYAHSRSVVHRDIKPANIMVGQFGETVLLDWGLAKVRGQQDEGAEKLADEVRQLKELGAGESVDGSPIGTPSYMPPEQADGRIDEVDERSDVWSLGALLYEILTGKPPFTGLTAFEVIGAVLTEDVAPVLERAKDAPPELAAIAMRCVQREPAQRYQGVVELAADIAAFQTGGMVSAYAYSPGAVVARWARKRWPVLATGAVALLLLCGVAVFSYGKVLEQRNMAVAANQRLDTKNNELLGLKLAAESREQLAAGQTERASLLALEGARLYARSRDWMPEVDRALRDCAGVAPYSRVLRDLPYNVDGASFFPDGQRLATVTHLGGAVWDLTQRGAPPMQLPAAADRIAVSPDGKWVAAGKVGYPQDLPDSMGQCATQLWSTDALDGEALELPGRSGPLRAMAFSPDSRYLAIGGEDKNVQIWDVSAPTAAPRVLTGHQQKVMSVAFSPDSRSLASTSADGSIRLWDFTAANPAPRELLGHGDQVYCCAFTPDGARLVSCAQDDTVRLWNLRNLAAPPQVLEVHQVNDDIISGIAISPDGLMLAAASYDEKTVRLWPLADLKAAPQVLRGHENGINFITFDPSGRRLVSCGSDWTARIWELNGTGPEPALLRGQEQVMSVAVSADGKLIAVAGSNPLVKLWEQAGQEWKPRLPLAPGGTSTYARSVALSRDGQLLAVGGFDRKLWLWELNHPAAPAREYVAPAGDIRSVTISPDKRWAAAAALGGHILLLDLHAPDSPPLQFQSEEQNLRCVAFSPDGRTLAVSGADKIMLYNAAELQAAPKVLQGHTGLVISLSFSSDSRRLASTGWDETVRIWQLDEPARPPQVIQGSDGWLYAVTLSPDGRFLAAGGKDNVIRIWNLAEIDAKPEILLGHQGTVTSLAFTADSRLLISGGLDASARVWHVGHEQLWQMVAAQPWRNLTQDEWQTFIGLDVPYHSTLAAGQ